MNKGTQEAVQFVLETHIMFNVLPNREKLELKPLFEIRNFKDGQAIATQDENSDGFYVLYSGKVRHKKNENGKIVSLGVFEEESSFGETSLIEEQKWQNDIIAMGDVTVLCLPSEKVKALISKYPAMAEHFKNHVGLIEVSNRLRALLGNAKYDNNQFMTILGHLGVKNIPEGKPIFVEGKEDPRLYYIEKGIVELSKNIFGNEEPLSLDIVYKSSVIGEGGALVENNTGGVQPHTARALKDTTVLVLKQEAVKLMLEINPDLHSSLKKRLLELSSFEASEIDRRKRAEGLDMRIRLAEGLTEEEYRSLEKKDEVSVFPIVRQLQESDSAAACLTMICNHYGKKFSLGQIKELTSLDAEKLTSDNIIRGAELIGFRSKAYSLNYNDIKTLQLPAVVGWEGYHFVVIFNVTDSYVQIADPAGGIKKIQKEDFVRSWTSAEVVGVEEMRPDNGLFIAFEPTQKFEQQETPKNPYAHFINYILPFKPFFGEAIIAALTINLLGMASPLFIQAIVDTVVVHHDVNLLNIMLGGMVLVTVLSTLTAVAQSLLLAHTTSRIDMRMMSEFYSHVLSLPMDFFLTRNKGEILARFGENQKIRAIIAGSTITVLLNLLMIVVYFLMMFGYNFKLTIVVIVFIPVYIGIVTYFTPRIKAVAQEIFLSNTQSQSYLIESLNGIEALKATANEYFARARWEEAFANNVNRSFHQAKLGLTSQSIYKLASLASSIIVLWIGANEVISGTMTIGELMGFNMLMGLVTAPVLQMVNLWNDLQEVRIAVDRVGDILSVKPEQAAIASPDRIPVVLRNATGRVVFDKVNFSYTTDDKTNYVMRDFDLVVEPGQHVAFVGPSGCGKSTIAKSILGFNRPNSGLITIDGHNLNDLDIYSLRRNIGVVLQDSFIFSGTVAENIALGDPIPDMQLVVEAAKLAGAEEFIRNYPLGYQTPIGEKGMGISGGQRQRICIARALYHKPKIMIFDEATSALDNESEQRITEQLKVVMHNRTTFTIAHRLSTIMHLDIIYYINEGKVQEMGSHQQLTDASYLRDMGYKGLYYSLAQTQFDLPPLTI